MGKCGKISACKTRVHHRKKRGDRHTRDILLNSSLLGWEATAQFIEELVERKFNLTENLEKEA